MPSLRELNMTTEGAKRRIKDLVNSNRGFKSNLTRLIGVAKSSQQMGETAKASPTVLEALQDVRKKLLEAAEKVEANLTEIIKLEEALETERADLEKIETELSAEVTRATVAINPLTAVIARMESDMQPPAPPPAPAAPPATYKPNEALRPKPLLRDSTPVEMRVWAERFKAFYLASKLDRAPIEEQHAYFKACLEDQLADRLSALIQPASPVLKHHNNREKSCMDLLDDTFRAVHPLFARRLDYFRATQERGQLMSDCIRAIGRLGDEAELAAMSVDDMAVVRYMTAVTDNKLLELMLQVKDPTKTKLEDVITTYETGRLYLKSINEGKGGGASAAQTASAPGQSNFVKPGQQNRGKPKNSDKKRNAEGTFQILRKFRADKRCHFCGVPLPEGGMSVHVGTCRGKAHTCTICSKSHLERVCFTKGYQPLSARPQAKQAAATQFAHPAKPGYAADSSDEEYMSAASAVTRSVRA